MRIRPEDVIEVCVVSAKMACRGVAGWIPLLSVGLDTTENKYLKLRQFGVRKWEFAAIEASDREFSRQNGAHV